MALEELASRARIKIDGAADRLDASTARIAATLTTRELEVLSLVAAGHTNREIGERLFISEKTAVRHVSNIFGKLGVHTRAEAARAAAESGLTSDGALA
jgi:DNA-binding NarL/FixJ family response regulator